MINTSSSPVSFFQTFNDEAVISNTVIREKDIKKFKEKIIEITRNIIKPSTYSFRRDVIGMNEWTSFNWTEWSEEVLLHKNVIQEVFKAFLNQQPHKKLTAQYKEVQENIQKFSNELQNLTLLDFTKAFIDDSIENHLSVAKIRSSESELESENSSLVKEIGQIEKELKAIEIRKKKLELEIERARTKHENKVRLDKEMQALVETQEPELKKSLSTLLREHQAKQKELEQHYQENIKKTYVPLFQEEINFYQAAFEKSDPLTQTKELNSLIKRYPEIGHLSKSERNLGAAYVLSSILSQKNSQQKVLKKVQIYDIVDFNYPPMPEKINGRVIECLTLPNGKDILKIRDAKDNVFPKITEFNLLA